MSYRIVCNLVLLIICIMRCFVYLLQLGLIANFDKDILSECSNSSTAILCARW